MILAVCHHETDEGAERALKKVAEKPKKTR
jgi:hypothetical protein